MPNPFDKTSMPNSATIETALAGLKVMAPEELAAAKAAIRDAITKDFSVLGKSALGAVLNIIECVEEAL